MKRPPLRCAPAGIRNPYAVIAGAKVVVALTLTTTVIAGWWFWHDRSLARARGADTLRIGYAVEAPYAFLTGTGRVTGEAPETARKVAARLGMAEPEWVLTEFGSLIEQLEAGRFDVIAAGMFITDERRNRVAFSIETARVLPGLLVAKGNPHGLHAYRHVMAKSGVKLAALAGSVEAVELGRKGLAAERVVHVPDVASGVSLLLAGKVGGLALSQPTVKWLAEQPGYREHVEAAEPFSPPEAAKAGRVAFAFRKQDERLRRAWDRALAEVLAQADHREMLNEYGFDDAEGEP